MKPQEANGYTFGESVGEKETYNGISFFISLGEKKRWLLLTAAHCQLLKNIFSCSVSSNCDITPSVFTSIVNLFSHDF